MSGVIILNQPLDVQGNPVVAQKECTLGREPFVRIDDGSESMNIDGRASGSPVNLWNGTGIDDTGADWTASGTGSETTASKKNGTNGWDTGVAALNDDTVFNNGSMVDIDGSYDSLDFWMQVKAYPVGSKMKIRWLDSADSVVGNNVNVDDYVDNMDIDEWKAVSIPIEDFGLDGNVQKLQFRYRQVAGQQYWFDDIETVSSDGGGPYKFRVAALDANTRYHLSMAAVLITATSTGWASDAFGNISAGLLHGLKLRHRRMSTSETIWKFVSRNNMQLFGQYYPQESFTFSDNLLMVGFMVKPDRAEVIITNDDVLEFLVRDDLSSLAEMRAFCHYGVETF
jgi:hypothetical protein